MQPGFLVASQFHRFDDSPHFINDDGEESEHDAEGNHNHIREPHLVECGGEFADAGGAEHPYGHRQADGEAQHPIANNAEGHPEPVVHSRHPGE